MKDENQLHRMLRLPQKNEAVQVVLIDWLDVATKYPSVFKEMALRVFNLNQISKDWFETHTGQRMSVAKIITKMNKDTQERAYETLLQFFIHHQLITPIFPYRRNKRIWYRFELYDLESLSKEDNYVRCQEGFIDPLSAHIAVVKSAIDYLALKLQ